MHRPEDTVVLGHTAALVRFVQQQRPHGKVGGGQDAALERTVEARGHLLVGPGQVHIDVAAAHQNPGRDFQRLAEVLAVVLEPTVRRPIDAVRNRCDALAQHPLSVIHPVLAGAHDGIQTVLVNELGKAGGTQLAARDHRLQVTRIGFRRAHVVENQGPDAVRAGAGIVELYPIDDLTLGPDVRHVHGKTGTGSADIHHVAGTAGKAQVHGIVKYGHQHAPVGQMGRAMIGIVMQDHIAGPVAAGEFAVHAAHVGRQGPAVHGCGVAFAKLTAVKIQDAGADVLRLTHDR